MALLSQMIAKFEAVDIDRSVQEAFDETDEQYADLNIEQMARGERSDGSSLPNYSPVSVSVFGKRPGPWTLYDTGDFYAGRFAELHEGSITIGSTDPKEELIEKKAGSNIWGLQDENKTRFAFGPFWSVLKNKLNLFK
jgi:hypothetical protein